MTTLKTKSTIIILTAAVIIAAFASAAFAVMINDPNMTLVVPPNPEPDVEEYFIEQATSPDGPWNPVGSVTPDDMLFRYLLPSDGMYWHRVRVRDYHHNFSDYSPLTEDGRELADLDRVPPSTPQPPTVLGRIIGALRKLFRGWRA